MKNLKYSFLLLLLVGIVACEPEEDSHTELGELPNPTFEITQGETPNKFVLTNTTADAFLTYWDLGIAGCFAEGEDPGAKTVNIDIPEQGEFDIIMTAFNQGGKASLTKSLTATQDNPLLCNDIKRLLAGTSQKAWKLAAEPNALHVGPSINDTWWGNDQAIIDSRACLWNDEFIFKANDDFEYDDKGDFFADETDGGVIPTDLGVDIGCHPYTDLAQQYQVWGPGIHKFSLTDSTITLTGLGAWMGLYKVGSTAEVTTPQSSVTYNIVSIEDNRLVVYTTFADTGHWRFTFVSE